MHEAQPTVPAVRDPKRRKAVQHAYRPACGGLDQETASPPPWPAWDVVDPDIVTLTNRSARRQPHLGQVLEPVRLGQLVLSNAAVIIVTIAGRSK
jgi:hypothetical protein